jgi:ParB family chromosome partitioning protein
MTSGNFRSHDVASIIVDRADRQRRELRNIDELAESIQRIGLINPIVITSDGVLVAGERRLTAIRQLAWTHVPVQFAEDLSDYELQTIELEENIKRENLPWQDEVAALARFHAVEGVSRAFAGHRRTPPLLLACPNPRFPRSYSLPRRWVTKSSPVRTASQRCPQHRPAERRAEENLCPRQHQAVRSITRHPHARRTGRCPAARAFIPLLNVSFHDWQESYDGPKFNLIHCDFPYGINVADSPRMDATIKDHYEDSPDIYWALLDRLALAMDNVVAESAHLIFWHSMKMNRHGETVDRLEAMGWKCNPFPLIWYQVGRLWYRSRSAAWSAAGVRGRNIREPR